MWARSSHADSPRFSALAGCVPATMPRLATPAIAASLVRHERDGAVAGQWLSDDTVFFNLCLTGRPANARGRFEGMAGGFHPVGDLFFLPAGRRYLARGGPGRQETLFVEMRAGDALCEGIAAQALPDPILRACMNLPPRQLRAPLLRMAQEVRAPGFASQLLLESLGMTVLVETARLLGHLREGVAHKGGLAPWRLRAIEERLREGAAPPTLDDLARLCGLSRRQLMRAFRQETGQTVGAYVQRVLLDRARALLRETDLPIAEIARQSGFASPTSFATAFRRAQGHPPRTYRSARQA